jgi:hypothetical protein
MTECCLGDVGVVGVVVCEKVVLMISEQLPELLLTEETVQRITGARLHDAMRVMKSLSDILTAEQVRPCAYDLCERERARCDNVSVCVCERERKRELRKRGTVGRGESD